MLNKDKQRELCYVVKITGIEPIEGSDNCECALVEGWRIMVRKGTFKPGDLAIYFEIDSKVDSENPAFAFLEKKHYSIKTQRYTFGGKGNFISQGLIMAAKDFGWQTTEGEEPVIIDDNGNFHRCDDESRFLTNILKIKYSSEDDNRRKKVGKSKYQKMMDRHPKFAKTKFARWCMQRNWAKKILYLFLGNKKADKANAWPVGKFWGVSKTDQERVENMSWVLKDESPYIVTEKCDGSSATYILERKRFGRFEFYVCSRNLRLLNENQKAYFDENIYWEMANKYNIESKMKSWLSEHPDAMFVCWQGEICGPKIQGNPHRLKENHLFLFHWTDSVGGRADIRMAAKYWKFYDMEVVPISPILEVLPNSMELTKILADGYYSPEVCEGQTDCPREGLVYYNREDPTFSFKNVSREYLLKKK